MYVLYIYISTFIFPVGESTPGDGLVYLESIFQRLLKQVLPPSLVTGRICRTCPESQPSNIVAVMMRIL